MAEEVYLQLLQKVLGNGTYQNDRTNTGCYSLFGEHVKFDISQRFPLLTTKKVYWKGVLTELIWFLKGKTDAKALAKDKVHIWDGNTTREFLDGRGLTCYEVGDCGPIYSHQWRHFGAEYKDCHTDYTGHGVDQVQYIIDEIRTNPHSRRIFMSAWNPTDLPKMCLPPCHVSAQFDVRDGKLSCHVTMRSCDVFLGFPFNIASYALLTYIIANVTGLKPDQLSFSLGNVHIYSNHVDAVTTQLKNDSAKYVWPTIEFQGWSGADGIDAIDVENVVLKNYESYPAIKAAMAV
jgi:thymidylate synthase